VRDEAPDLKTEDLIMCCLVRAIIVIGSTALYWALASFSVFVIFLAKTVGLLGRVMSPQIEDQNDERL
jgi:hypothetical protein